MPDRTAAPFPYSPEQKGSHRMPWYWILLIISAIVGPFEAMHALNKARRRREEQLKQQRLSAGDASAESGKTAGLPGALTAYIWDLDGTLLDSYGSMVSSLAQIAEEYRTGDTYDDIMKVVKQGSVSAYLREVSEKTGADYRKLYDRYREISHGKTDEITLIPGAAETLEALQDAGAEHFVYTHRGKSTGPLLDRLDLTRFFTEIVTFENGFQPKPSGEGVEYLTDKYGLDRNATAYVGDRTLDVYCAKDAGVRAILYLPDGSCVTPTGREDRIIRQLEELIPQDGR